MTSSLYLTRLSEAEVRDLREKLYAAQGGKCFICDEAVDLTLHDGHLDIDHIEPLSHGGKDSPENLALAHRSCNRSKQAADLRVARVLARFERVRLSVEGEKQRPNLSDVLSNAGGSRFPLQLQVEDDHVRFSFPQIGDNKVIRTPIYEDTLSNFRYFFAVLPIEYLHHDDRINPRAIGSNIRKLVEEFHQGRPQLHIALAWVRVEVDGAASLVKVFDGQHKAAAQVLLGARQLPVRVFPNPDLDVLLETNTHAGTSLKQVAFDKAVQRHLGNTLYRERIDQYRKDRGLAEDDLSFSERDLVAYFKGEQRETKRYILDSVRDGITHDPDNRLMLYVDFGGRARDKPLSYSTIEKTFYSHFIYADLLDTPLDFGLETGKNPRELERSQVVRLMNVVADEILVDKFDPVIGAHRIEQKLRDGEDIAEDHLRAVRMVREEALYVWLSYMKQIVTMSLTTQGRPFDDKRLFQYEFGDGLWEALRNYVRSLKKLPLWVNKDLALTVFGGKQTYQYWQKIFETGRTPEGKQVLVEPLNFVEMVKG